MRQLVCHTKRVEHSTGRSLSPVFTSDHGSIAGDAIIYCLWWKSRILLSVKPEVGLIITIALMKNTFNVRYLENGERYDVAVKGGQIGN